jgi:type III pantothenate kinase
MLLAIDVGNTQIKLAVFEQNNIKIQKIVSLSSWKIEVQNILDFNDLIDNIVVSSVGHLDENEFIVSLNLNRYMLFFIVKSINWNKLSSFLHSIIKFMI